MLNDNFTRSSLENGLFGGVVRNTQTDIKCTRLLMRYREKTLVIPAVHKFGSEKLQRT